MHPRNLAAFVLFLAACQGPTAPVSLTTGGGHIVDGRSWAVGSQISLNASWNSPEAAQLRWSGDVVTSPDAEDVDWRERMMFPALPSPGWASASGVVSQEGDFSADVVTGVGSALDSVPLQAEEVDGWRLGLALDDCPEFADLVMQDDPAVIEGSQIMVIPAPVNAAGEGMMGGFEFFVDSPDLELPWGGGEGWGGSPIAVTVGQDGIIEMDVVGESFSFPIHTVTAEEVVAMTIASQAEKHGEEDSSLLVAVGLTAEGRQVHGVSAQWSNGGQGVWTHAENGQSVEACLGEACSTWGAE